MKTEHIIALMRDMAGVTSTLAQAGPPNEDFVAILEGMKDIHRAKTVLYGDYLKTHGSDPQLFALMEHFADIKRKYVRAENFMKLVMSGKDMSTDELFDTYSDLAVYAAMGVQLLIHLGERDQNEQASSPGVLHTREQHGGGSVIPDDLVS